ncbi:MAG: serine protease [Phototrophicaceae bacterium]
MASKNLEQGIMATQQQDMQQGKRLLKIALKNDPLTPQERVQAFLWLAETDGDAQFKVTQYQKAIQIDPTNQDVMQRLTYWAQQAQQQVQAPTPPAQGLPPINPTPTQNWQTPNQQANTFSNPQQFVQGMTPSQGMPLVNPNQGQNWQAPNQQQQFVQGLTPSQGMPPVNLNQFGAQYAQTIHLQAVQRTVGILNGVSGKGTGFFVTRDGLIATTRHVVGGMRQVVLGLLDGRQVQGEVVRAFPTVDLVLIQAPVTLDHLLNISQAPMIPDDMPITVVAHHGEAMRSTKRRSMNEVKAHWFPTLINFLQDAGGNPIFDANNLLVGMLTNNKQRSNQYLYGLNIDKIYQCINQYLHEKGQLQGQQTIYCDGCGIISRAPSFNGYWCEKCGKLHPYTETIAIGPQPTLAAFYGENESRPCPNCNSQAGFYDRQCLRCGFQL